MTKPALDVHLIIFAKAPLAGFAKTRLIPALGEQGAAKLAKQLLSHTLSEAMQSAIASIELCLTPSIDQPCWNGISLPKGLYVSDQGDGDLGERMASAAKRAFKKHASVMLIGTDCPALTHQYINNAVDALAGHDACLAPVSDGGYALIGLNDFHPSLFENIPWSTDQVSALTIEKCRHLNWQLAHLKTLHDIDEAEDLKFLPEKFKSV